MATQAEEVDVDGVMVRLTNPDKVYFPKLGSKGTKRHLVDYYRAVGVGPMLTALRDRPTHLQRFPDGIEGEEIYQKRVPEKHPDYLQTCRVTFPSGRTADALKVTHPSAIVWAAQMGTVTLHPWQVRCPDTDHPDELRIDLDPQPGTAFAEARTIAVDVLKPLLDELGLIGYPKTSGGRGVHVFLRITTDWDFIAVRRAGIALAREVERRVPDLVTTSWWKEERGQRLFIDYNQNARDRTFASAYSVRATPIATVSTPLTWDELATADPDDYTMATVPALVAERGDPMAGLDSVAQSIEPLLEMVAADEQRGLGDLPYPSVFCRKWVCAGVSCRTKMRSGLRSSGALRCRSSEDVDSADNHSPGDLAGRVLGRAGWLQPGRRT
jgi:DNA ligase D